jgi:hypothetical protein
MKLCAQLASRASYLGPSWPTFLMLPAQFWVTSAVPSMTMKNSFPSSPSRTLKTARQIVRTLISKDQICSLFARLHSYVTPLIISKVMRRHFLAREEGSHRRKTSLADGACSCSAHKFASVSRAGPIAMPASNETASRASATVNRSQSCRLSRIRTFERDLQKQKMNDSSPK